MKLQEVVNEWYLPVTIQKSPFEGAEVGEYTEMFMDQKPAQEFAKFIISKKGKARIGKGGRNFYVYHKGAGPISKAEWRKNKDRK